MILYLIKSSAALFIMLTFYHLVLINEKAFIFNRFFLLASAFIAMLAPLLVIDILPEWITSAKEIIYVPEYSIPTRSEFTVISATSTTSEHWNIYSIVLSVYLVISFIFLIRFIKNLVGILQKSNKGIKIPFGEQTIVLIEDTLSPFSFFNHIFINRADYHSGVEPQILRHEVRHTKAFHSIDVIFLELLLCLLWWNPVFCWLRNTILLNHEFYADQQEELSKIKHYKRLIYRQINRQNINYPASGFNYSFIKKRLTMLDKTKNGPHLWVKKLMVLPFIILTILLVSKNVIAQKVTESQLTYVEIDGRGQSNSIPFFHSPSGTKALSADEITIVIKQQGVSAFDEIDFIYAEKRYKGAEIAEFIYSEDAADLFSRGLRNEYKAIIFIKTSTATGKKQRSIRIPGQGQGEGNINGTPFTPAPPALQSAPPSAPPTPAAYGPGGGGSVAPAAYGPGGGGSKVSEDSSGPPVINGAPPVPPAPPAPPAPTAVQAPPPPPAPLAPPAPPAPEKDKEKAKKKGNSN